MSSLGIAAVSPTAPTPGILAARWIVVVTLILYALFCGLVFLTSVSNNTDGWPVMLALGFPAIFGGFGMPGSMTLCAILGGLEFLAWKKGIWWLALLLLGYCILSIIMGVIALGLMNMHGSMS